MLKIVGGTYAITTVRVALDLNYFSIVYHTKYKRLINVNSTSEQF